MPIEFKFIEDMKEVSATSYITIVKGKDFPEEHPKLDAKTLGQIKQSQKFKGKLAEVFSMNVLSHDKLIECSFVGADGELKGDAYLKLGGDIYKAAQKHHEIVLDTSAIELEHEAMCDILIGFQLASYKFDKYFVDKASKEEKTEKHILYIYGAPNKASIIEEAQYISASVSLARDLVNEPANVLSTTEFKKRILDLKSIGLKIEILEKSELEKLDMHALLGVARGSACPPYVAIMRWNGSQSKEDQPLVFVGKGVVFDSGGISLKRPDGMEEMKGDMGGAASVVGLMHCLAKRKAKIHAVGIIGLVENMVDAAAQRPGDVVKSRSGQTIEIVNTDAEGRLVLADVLHYAIEKFKPKIVVDLATLTGAVLIALGNTMAGLFSNDEALTQNLLQAASKTGEKLWHMPLCEEYDKQIDSKIADMRNSAGRLAASSTAAQFLKRFVGEVAWAHLDIEGTAFDAPKLSYSTSWATGFGVRLLNNMIKNTYEK